MDRSLPVQPSQEPLLQSNAIGSSNYGTASTHPPFSTTTPANALGSQPDANQPGIARTLSSSTQHSQASSTAATAATDAIELTSVPSSRTQSISLVPTTARPQSNPSPPPSPSPLSNASHPPSPINASPLPNTSKVEGQEWRSWKIQVPWLSFMLFAVTSLIVAIGTLDQVSRHNSGFVRLGDPPSLITRIPGFGNPIWTQGVLYTAFPAFVMTMYRTTWEATIMAFAERQPFVELKKPGGRNADVTIDLDYRSAIPFFGWYIAARNKHFLLAACMFWSALLAFLVVPLTSFIFTPIEFTLNSTIPLSTTTLFSDEVWLNYTRDGPLSEFPDIGLSMSAAGAVHIQDGQRPRWTAGEYVFGQIVSAQNTSNGSVVVDTFAYSAFANCEHVPDSSIRAEILTPDETPFGAVTVMLQATDRGCKLQTSFNFRVSDNTDLVQPYLWVWSTRVCPRDSGITRLGFVSAIFDKNARAVSNFSLVSCAPLYRRTPGALRADIVGNSSLLPQEFVPGDSRNSSDVPSIAWVSYEHDLTTIGCINKFAAIESNSDFGNLMYQIASKQNLESPLAPASIIDAVHTLFSTTFAIFASSAMFKSLEAEEALTGVYSKEETRIVVVPFVAYIIIAVLVVVAVLNIMLFVSARQNSTLFEEPVGLLGAAGLLHQSSLVQMVEDIHAQSTFDGRTRETARKENFFRETDRFFADDKNRIVRRQP